MTEVTDRIEEDRIADIVAELRARFVARAGEQRAQLAALYAEILGARDPWAAIAKIEHLCHTLHGTAGTFGYSEIGAAAGAVESLCRAMAEEGASSDDPAFAWLAEALDRLCALIDALVPPAERVSRFSKAGSRHLSPFFGSA